MSAPDPENPALARALICSRCGGPFAAGSETCPWCQAGIALEDRHLSAVCERCSKRLDKAASFCGGCGFAVRAQALRRLPANAACPRCRATLRLRAVDTREITECSSCGGMWLVPDDFAALCERAEEGGSVRRALLATLPPTQPVAEQRVAYLKCVACSEPMHRRNFGGGSGVIIDVCKDHGVWFDHTELVRVMDYARDGGLERAREREERRLAEERARRADSPAPSPPLPPFSRERGPFEISLFEGDLVSLLAGLASRLLSGRR
ncbi:MAG: zf-TFIIB domain-containing protein [Planctomycetes bacterium]|nr:zf-TFIIB domain-containing protein [Planctomycetota bacterium]